MLRRLIDNVKSAYHEHADKIEREVVLFGQFLDQIKSGEEPPFERVEAVLDRATDYCWRPTYLLGSWAYELTHLGTAHRWSDSMLRVSAYHHGHLAKKR